MVELLEKAIPRNSIFKTYLSNCVEYISKLRPDLTRDRIENYIKNVLVAKNQKMINNLNQAIEMGADLAAVRHGEDRLWPTINAIRSSDPSSDSKARSYGNLVELKNYDLSAWMNDYKNKIISPFGTSYETVDKCSSFLKGMVDMKKAERKKEKKLMLKAKKDGNKTAEVFHNNNQATIKINMNSYIGAMGSGYNNLSSIANYNSVTSISRFFIMNSYAHAERFLESNFYFRNEEQLINFIVTCNLLGPAPERINEVMSKMNFKYPTVEEVTSFLIGCLERYDNVRDNSRSRTLISKCTREQLCFMYYMSNMKHLVFNNPEFFRPWFDELFSSEHVQYVDCQPGDIGKLDGDLVIVLSTVYNDMLPKSEKSGNNISVYDCIETAPEIAKKMYCIGLHMQRLMDQIQEVFDLFMDHNVAIGYVNEHKNQYRDAVVVSDTDSIIFTTKSWVEWYTGGRKIDSVAFNVNALVVYWISKANANILYHVSRNFGALKDDLLTMNMKNEFMMPVEILTSLKKHYASILKIQEGVFYKKPRMDIKGVGLRGSNFSSGVLNYTSWFIETLIYDIYNNGTVDAEKKILEVLRFERLIYDSLMRGETQFLSIEPVKNREEYAEPDKSIFFNYTMWEQVFGEKYGHIVIPTKCYVVPLINVKSKSFVEGLKSRNETMGLAWERFVKSTDKAINRIPINPITNQIPEELRPICDFKNIVFSNTRPLYLMMSTLGITAGNNKKKPVLFSELYGWVSEEEGAKALEHIV